ncbi:ABC transporter ATP-binding protein [Aquabacter sp. P-9]|uniref:ABC transporter ATP-binding protein n=1 Tax=Aquabacter sediminis TaxID=3029197 RepID=UPI00237E75BB|nr:ABC transporter ATP-binding protein [Aquabacter sp. P-9]MDE1567783.1 ABC transporter ATP-binding protein [Aquabacter sp. P-9]
MMIEARGIRVRRGGTAVLDGVSLTAARGELLGLIGPNGAGKTTLLRALCGLDAVEAGTLTIDGQRLADLGRAALGRTISYLAQGGRIHWPMRVDELVALGRLPHTPSPDAYDPAVERALAAADVLSLRHRITGSLSGGERARVLLARALAVEAPVLLADEPVAALDPYHQLQVMELMRDTARAGTAVVLVLHDLTLAARFCHRLALMQGGRILAEGPPEDVLHPDRMETAFGVRIEAGIRDGQRFVLPWRRCGRSSAP